MLNTLTMLRGIVDLEDEKLSLEDISIKYRQTLSPALFAAAFSKTYRMIIGVSKNYFGLTNADVVSFALEKLDYCLLTYEPEKAAFSTYYITTLKNRFREEMGALNTHKRKAMYYSDSYESLVAAGYDLEYYEEQNFDCLDMLNSAGLNERELRYCLLTIDNYSNAEIAKLLGVSIMTLSNMRKGLREKLMHLTLGF